MYIIDSLDLYVCMLRYALDVCSRLSIVDSCAAGPCTRAVPGPGQLQKLDLNKLQSLQTRKRMQKKKRPASCCILTFSGKSRAVSL